MPYFADRVGIDLLGKADAHIAHESMRHSLSGMGALVEFKPGHMKFDYGYSIERLKPDLVLQLWQHPETIQPYLLEHYRMVRVGSCIYVRIDSSHILWDRLPSDGCQ